MRRIFVLFITVSLIISCGKDSNTYTVEGSAIGFEDNTEIMVYSVEDNNQPVAIDTLVVMGGKFKAEYDKSDKLLLNYLAFEEPRGTILFFPENEDLKIVAYKDSLTASYVTGSKQNDMYREFMANLRDFNESKKKNTQRYQEARQQQDGELIRAIQTENVELVQEEQGYKQSFIKENNNSIFSLMLLSEMLTRSEITAVEAKEILDSLPPKVAASQIAASVNTTIANMKRAEIGEIAPDFSAPTPDGEMLSLKESMGKYTIIDFWASWCRPCRLENPNVVNVYNKYHDKGLNIISVSLDKEGQKERWLKAIEDDNMDWYHVSNLKFWQDPIARTYNVRGIPATFLIDEEGKIIDKNLRGPALERRISGLLGGQ